MTEAVFMKRDRKKHLERLDRRRRERRGRRSSARVQATVRGIVSITSAGFGFVKPEATGAESPPPDIFVPPQFLNGAMDGDEVLVSLLPPRREDENADRGPAGQVEEVLRRGRETLVGEVLAGRLVRPLSKHFPEDIPLKSMAKGAQRGDWVEVRLLHTDDGEPPQAKILRRIGRVGEIASDLDAVAAEFGLLPPYTGEEEAAALALPEREIAREDLRGRFTVTVDPTDAKDFDDAVSLAPGAQPGTVEVGVHISDVAAWIAPRTAADRGAAARGFSCYLPGRTLPMLPKQLTARISLREGVDSLAHTVLLTVDPRSGQVLASRRMHSRIRVDRRLTYAEVQEFLDSGRTPAEWSPELATAVGRLVEVTRAMRRNRARTEEFIELSVPEIRVLCDEKNNTIDGLVRKNQREADFLVEECMLAANSAVGNELVEKGIAGIFRVHPEPDPEKIEELRGVLADSFGLASGDLLNRTVCNAFLKALPDDPRRPVIMSLFMRSLPRAGYAAKPELHYGLGKVRYAHFTSPIRRYADLLVHQQLWNFDRKTRLRAGRSLESVALRLCEQEEIADSAFFAANDRLKLRYLELQLGSDPERFYEGVIAKVFRNGFQVDIAELGIYGMVAIDDLPGNFERIGDELRQTRGRRVYRCGDYVYLKLSQIDFARGSALFRPAGQA